MQGVSGPRESSTARAGVIVSVIFTTSAVLGFVREIVLAGYFGASAEMDALLVAMVIPKFFLNMLGEASMGAAVVPVFIAFVMPQALSEQRRIMGSAFTLLALVLTAVASAGVAFAPQVAHVLAPGFSGDKLVLTASLMRMLAPTVLVLGFSNFAVGILHSLKHFGPASATGVVYNLAVVLATIPLAGSIGIWAPALGVFAGCVLQFVIMAPTLVRTGLFPSVGWSFRDDALVRMWRLFWPIFIGGLIVTVLDSVDKIMGSFLAEGSISALGYATKIAGGPSRIFAMAISVVLFPAMAKNAAENSSSRGDVLVNGVNLAAFLTLPWTALLIALSTPVVFVVLQRGAFDASATALVALPLMVYCLGDFADGISTMVNNAYYAHHDSKRPTYIYVGSNVVRAVIVVSLVPLVGYIGIALGQAIAVDLALVWLLLSLRRHVPDLDLRVLGIGFGKIALAAASCGIVGRVVFDALSGHVAGDKATTVLALAAATVPALAVYYFVTTALRCREAAEFRRRFVQLTSRLGHVRKV